MTEPETVLDRLEALRREGQQRIDFNDIDSGRRITKSRHEYDKLMSEHEAALLAVVRAAEQACIALGYIDKYESPIPQKPAYGALQDALRPLLQPAEPPL